VGYDATNLFTLNEDRTVFTLTNETDKITYFISDKWYEEEEWGCVLTTTSGVKFDFMYSITYKTITLWPQGEQTLLIYQVKKIWE